MTTSTPLWGQTAAESEVFGERLRDARLIQRMKAQDVAEAAGMPPDRYSRLENNLVTVLDGSRAMRLAVALDFPMRFLASPPVTPVQRGSLLFRANKSMTRGEEEQLVAWARLIGDLLQRSVQENVRLPYIKIPRLSRHVGPSDAAAATRAAVGLASEEPIPHLTRILERAGVYIAVLDYSAELHAKHHDAFSTWVGSSLDWPLIVVRASSSWERTRLSIAHEIGHIVMHHVRRDGDLESEAYQFSSELLLPQNALREEWPHSVTLRTLMPLKRKWGISLAGLIEHGYRNDLFSPMQRTNLYKQMSNRRDRLTGERWRIQEPGWTDREPERPKLIAKVSETAFGPGVELESISSAVFGWRPDLLDKVFTSQATPWAQGIVSEYRTRLNNEKSAPLATVVPLRSARQPHN
jgi:Zn-dependent peptidase ImmA (M78 family)/transcriptional regulator with XRE-family HTH domain